MRRFAALCAAMFVVTAGIVIAQQKPPASPPADTSVTIAGKVISVKYSAPSVKGRQMFGAGGVISKDPTYPVWRLGANAATALHTEADLDIKGNPSPCLWRTGRRNAQCDEAGITRHSVKVPVVSTHARSLVT